MARQKQPREYSVEPTFDNLRVGITNDWSGCTDLMDVDFRAQPFPIVEGWGIVTLDCSQGDQLSLLTFLHEVGHVAHRHAECRLATDTFELMLGMTQWHIGLSELIREQEAWAFAFTVGIVTGLLEPSSVKYAREAFSTYVSSYSFTHATPPHPFVLLSPITWLELPQSCPWHGLPGYAL